MKAKNKKRETQFEITEEDYRQNLAEGADPKHAPKPGKYIGRRGSFIERHPEVKSKKIKISILLDSDVINYFKRLAALPDAAPYQTQINNALRRVMMSAKGASKSELLKDKDFIRQVAAEVKRLSR